MVGTDRNVAAWMATNEPFNGGDHAPLLELLRPDVTWATGDVVHQGRDAVATLLDQLRAAGWSRHEVRSISGQGPMVASTYVNVFADGQEYAGAGIAMYDDEGRITAMSSLGEFPEGLVGD